MSQNSNIEWTDTTWNPTTGCTKVSPGCKHCYAEQMALRLQAMGQANYRNGFRLTLQPQMLDAPLHWKKPRRIFVNSMSDLFHPDVPFDFVDQVFRVMIDANQHQFQILTKRPQRMAEYLTRRIAVLPNVWLGTSVEDQLHADERIPHLLACPAAVRFLSVEPMLEPIDLRDLCVDWVIVGGESGLNRRPFDKNWARSIRDQCQHANIPFFFKQGSSLRPGQDDELDGRTWKEFPKGRP